VDTDRTVIRELQCAARSVAADWSVEFATTLPEALEQLSHGVFDVVAADVEAHGIDGGSFLDEVAARQPRAARFLVSDSGARGMLMRAVGSAHQHLAKPLDPGALFAQLARTLALGDLLSDARLKCLVGRLRNVPSLPSIYLAILAELRQEEPSGQKVGELVARDPGTAAKILQLVNSPFFGFRVRVTDAFHAVQLLGLETVRALVLSLHIFDRLDEPAVMRFRLGRVWRHSLATTNVARMIARLQDRDTAATGEAFTAALLHDIGKLVFALSLPEEYAAAMRRAERDQVPLWTAEQDALSATHAEVGAYLLGLWGLPEPIVEAVAWHHRPSECPSPTFCPLGVVHAANCIEHAVHPADSVGPSASVDQSFLDRFQAAWQFQAWSAACLDAEAEYQELGLRART